MIEIMYGEAGPGKGYRILNVFGGEALPPNIESYFKFAGKSGEHAVTFKKVNDSYLLIFYSALSGTSVDRRAQFFAHAYLFDAEEADELFMEPKNIFRAKVYCNPDEPPKEFQHWEGKSSQGSQQKADDSSGSQVKAAYFTSCLEPDVKMYHVFGDEKGHKAAVRLLINYLELLPLKLRKEVSFNTNAKSPKETDYDIIILSKKHVDMIINGKSSGMTMETRIIKYPNKFVGVPVPEEYKDAWNRFQKGRGKFLSQYKGKMPETFPIFYNNILSMNEGEKHRGIRLEQEEILKEDLPKEKVKNRNKKDFISCVLLWILFAILTAVFLFYTFSVSAQIPKIVLYVKGDWLTLLLQMLMVTAGQVALYKTHVYRRKPRASGLQSNSFISASCASSNEVSFM